MLWAWCIFFGATFALSVESVDADIYRYIELPILFKEFGVNSYVQALEWIVKQGEIDFYAVSVAYLSHAINANYLFITTLLSLVFGYFLSRNILILLQNTNWSFYSNLLIILFFFVNPIWNINNARFYTALQIAVYAILSSEMEGRRVKIFYLLLTPLVHFSFIVVIGIYIFSKLFSRYAKISFFIFLISVIASEYLTEDVISDYSSMIDYSLINDRGKGYVDKELLNLTREEAEVIELNFYIKYYQYILKHIINIMMMMVYFSFGKTIIKDKLLSKLFAQVIITVALGNFLYNHFVIGRFHIFSSLLAICFVIKFLYLVDMNIFMKLTKNIRYFLMLPIIFFCIVTIRIGLYHLSFSSIFSTPFIALFQDNFSALNDFIKFY